MIIDILASEYGWKMDYIMNDIRIDEILALLDSLEKRKKGEALLSLQIEHNPYSEDPNALFRALSEDTRGSSRSESFDKEGLNKLKQTLSKKSKFIEVK